MAAKESQEMRNALRLVAEGVPVRIAAAQSEVWFTSVYARLAQARKRIEKDAKTKGVHPRVTSEAVAQRIIKGKD